MNPSQPPLPARRVLIVEDLEDCLETMVALISTRGCDVRVARDGKSAVAMAQSFLPHVILLDLGLPVMNGFEAATRIRADARLQHCIIVAVSGHGMQSDKERSAQAGVDLHLIKPVSFEDLSRLLEDPGIGKP